MTIKAFVAGATGYTGQEIVKELLRNEIHTIAHIRPDSAQLTKWQTQFKELGAEVNAAKWDPKAIATSINNIKPDLVFALLGTTKKRARNNKHLGSPKAPETYDKIDYGYTAMLIDATSQFAPQARFIYLSALGVSKNAPGAYMQARWKTEQYLIESRLPYTIVQPCFITGPDRAESRPLERFGAILSDSVLSAASKLGGKKLSAKYTSINARDLARAMVKLGLNAKAENKIIHSEALRD
tara:strand:- start:186 stop:905 length:720 start_codon:yes stop_codon:yes gene_type:complete